MPINLTEEELLSLTDAAKALPAIDGRRPHVSTIWRWIRRGIQGVYLEHVRLGHRVCTSREALNPFVQRLADADEQPVQKRVTTSKRRTAKQRARAVAQAERDLEASGI